MNAQEPRRENHSSSNSYRSLQLLSEISRESSLSQRDLSRRLNIALGLVNSYLRNLVARGLVKISEIPPKRYAYYLTPQGFAEKSRLTYQVLRDYTSLYRDARKDLVRLFEELAGRGCRRFVFAGREELAEIALLSLQESGGTLAAIVDDERAGERFFKVEVQPLASVREHVYDAVIITSYMNRKMLRTRLEEEGVPGERIYAVGQEDSSAGEGEDDGDDT